MTTEAPWRPGRDDDPESPDALTPPPGSPPPGSPPPGSPPPGSPPPGSPAPGSPPPGSPPTRPAGRQARPGSPDVAAARALLEAASVPRPRSRDWLGSRRRQVVAACVVLGAVGFIAFQGLTNATQYFLTTRQAVAQRAQLGAKPFRIEGTVEPDVRQTPPTIRFDIYAEGVTVPIVSSGSPPQL
ncbi:MAG: cytochrome c maturation protein CcmE domain-containing protein, partial [Acidimicrobiales bacterium]